MAQTTQWLSKGIGAYKEDVLRCGGKDDKGG